MNNRINSSAERLRNEVLNRRAPSRKGAKKPQYAKAQSNGRFNTMNAFVDNSARLVSPMAGMVWLVLFREVKPPQGLAEASQRQIAECLGVHRRTVIRALKELEDAHLLTVVKRGGVRQKSSSIYRVHGKPKVQETPVVA